MICSSIKAVRALLHFLVFITAVFMFACNDYKPANWIPQYPDCYKPMYRAELVYADSDYLNPDGRIIWAINKIYVNDSNEVWALKDWHSILYSKDGRKFKRMSIPNVHQLNSLKGTNGELWAVGCYGSIIHYKNKKWLQEGKGLTNKDIWALWVNNQGSEGWAVGNNGLIMHDTMGKWCVVQPDLTEVFIHDVWLKPDGSEGWAVGNEGVILHYTGGKWEMVEYEKVIDYHSKGTDLMKVWMNSGGIEGWAVGNHGTILHYKAGVWTHEASNLVDFQLNNITMKPDGSEGWIVGDNSAILHYRSGNWGKISDINGSEYLKSIYSDDSNFWVVGGEAILHSSDNMHVNNFHQPFKPNVYQCIAGNKNALWVGCWDNVILKLTASMDSTYPTLANIKYHITPANPRKGEDASCSIDFQITGKNGSINQFLPIEFSLNGKLKDSTNYHKIPCAFSHTDASHSSGTWTANFSLRQFNIDVDKKKNNQLKLKLSIHTVNANEDIVYDLKEGINDFLTLRY